MKIIDLRSDTVTQPTTVMRRAMFQAAVGDDGYGEDPTVKALEELAAQMTGKEAGLFVTSGTQGNQIAAMVHTKKCDEIICEATSHIFGSETGGIGALAGAQPYPVIGINGKLSPELIEPAIRRKKMNAPCTSLITIENTHAQAGGTFYTPIELAAIRELANQHSLPIHIDGARIFNAAIAQDVTVAELAQYADSMQLCLSKGLCAPVGSVLVGTGAFIQQARRYRRLLGGGMRKAGIIAAAGIVALKTMVNRLNEDHLHARMLGEAIASTNLNLAITNVKTNIVIFDISPLKIEAAEYVKKLALYKIKALAFGRHKIRMVTHNDISRSDIDYTINSLYKLTNDFQQDKF
ncbi:L-allo-threonine aldolase [Sporomusa rhizae]|uniref:threonine aldolase family protein n=1 Tax=Sporomusa rhizae TaxID=357999 RepID=UPI00352AF30A